MSLTSKALLVLTGLLVAVICLLTFERPPVVTTQNGFRGTGMEQLQNPRLAPARIAANRVPDAPDPADTDGPKASEIFENVQVLGELSAAQFGRIMQAMTEWISPSQGCNYCHNPENLASDEVYTKVVARRMLQMNRTINVDWSAHVGQAGVTCYTCHRGNAVPQQVWSTAPTSRAGLQAPRGQNHPAPNVNQSSLPADPYTPFLLGDHNIRNISRTSLPGTNPTDVMRTEWTYALMTSMSQALGVNCTFCHNSRAFSVWEQSPPQRLTAWHGIRMARTINRDYIEPLTPQWAANPRGPAEGPNHPRLGVMGDALKVNCATCHQGVNRPFLGAPMARDYPELNLVTTGPLRAAEATPR
ncbi:photosynthetic reaction center cytochrome PufC [Falsiroseomonas sp. CW058]|uniref:photosynthetic reaction center cytochrome PufC n=1 Tax=Falsiroseomonas sp. CW058 TaxID=3388664 RepID=UPI003D31329C